VTSASHRRPVHAAELRDRAAIRMRARLDEPRADIPVCRSIRRDENTPFA
jgi:IS5 family transposase